MRLVTRNFNRPTTSFFPSLWNEFFADDFLTKSLANSKSCKTVAPNWYHSVPAVNIKNREKHYFIEVAAPGFKKSDFKVELDHGKLTISAKKAEEKEDENDRYTHKEFTSNTFKRTFTIPENLIDVEGIEASYEAGVLVVSIPKKEVEDKKLSIDVL